MGAELELTRVPTLEVPHPRRLLIKPGHVHEPYWQVHCNIGTDDPSGSVGDRRQHTYTSGFGEYAVNRTIDGVNHVYLIYFLPDADGIWRLDSM